MDDELESDRAVSQEVSGDYDVVIYGFENDFAAFALRSAVQAVVSELSDVFDLSTLEGITVAVDYDAALLAIDKGLAATAPETRTNDEISIGVAKSIPVRRNGAVKTHIVFLADVLCCLVVDTADREHVRAAIGMIAHELAHVEDNARRERQFPGSVLERQAVGFMPANQLIFSEAFWVEYAASRASAIFNRSQVEHFRESLCERLQRARSSAQDAVADYRYHGDVERLFVDVTACTMPALTTASYLFGHLDGLSPNNVPTIADAVVFEEADVLEVIERLVVSLRELWDNRDSWKEYEDILVLGQTAFELFPLYGLYIEPLDDGRSYIHVP